jgi:uncharacterized repeat protein (TIGR01451 family)
MVPGGSVICVFENTKRGSITIVKDAVPNDAQDFAFTTTGTGLSNFSLDDDSDGTLMNTKTFTGLNPGTYSVAEGAVAGWDLTSATCTDGSDPASISLQASEQVTCTFVNTMRGKIIIEKQTNPDGAAGSFGFTGEIVASLSDGQSAEKGNLVPGTYTVTESNPTPPFDLVMITCDDAAGATDSTGDSGTRTATFRLDPGETVKCTFTNVQRGTITIIKDAVPNDPQDFHYNTTGGLSAFDLDDDADATLSNTQLFNDVVPGNYSVAEVAVTGWDLTDLSCNSSGVGTSTSLNGATASLTLGPAGSIVCTYENTKRGHIIVDKQTLPGGDPQSFNFTTSGAGYGPFSLTDAADPDSQEVVPGAYTVSETVPAGWDQTSASCDNGETPASLDVGPGETVTCVFENTKLGTIIIEKQTSPAGGTGFVFTGDAAATLDDGEQKIVTNLEPGTYTSTEADPTPAYDLTSIICDDAGSSGNLGTRTATFDLDPGEVITCVFTNVQRGTITIIKDAQPNDAQDFGYDVSGFDGPIHFELDDDAVPDPTLSNMQTFENVPPGDYSVTEGDVAGWDLTDLDCVSLGGSEAQIEGATANLTMADGGSITCTYVNSKPSISIVKTAGTATDGGEFVTEPGNVTYHYVVTNTGPIALNGITVRDDNGTPANLADDFNATCPKTTLAAAESMECTATVAVAANRTNVATTTGTSDGGTTVQDTDDAVVRVPALIIDKAYVGNTGGTAVNGTGIAKVGDTLTYTLAYDLTNGPVTNGIITDTLPNGLAYVANSATGNAQFTFVSYDSATRVLTWNALTVSTDGSVTYKVTVLDGSFNLPQPLVNTATIDSDQTVKDDDTANVLVQIVLAATATPVVTLPPTDSLDSGDQAPSNPGFGLMLALLVLAGFGLVLGYLTPTPARARREEVRRR